MPKVELLDYYPYGASRISTGDRTSQRQYIGQIYDTDTGLNYLNARYYKADIGQFISQDPVFRAIGNPGEIKNLTKVEQDKLLMDPQAMNSYSYARNNPIRYSDPDGLWFKEVITGQQSFSDFQIEIGQASNQLSQDSGVWNAAISHPYIAGATIGVGSGATALGVSYLAGGGLVMDSLSTGQLISSEGIQAINIRNGIQSGLQNSKVGNLLKDMFRPQNKIGGGTIEAIKREIMSGGKELTGGKSHMLKGEQLINRINNIQRSETLNKIESQGLNQFKNVLNKLLKK